jgi:penicillin amidase
MPRATLCLLTVILSAGAETIPVSGLQQPVEILVDRWGVPHIYAKTFEDAFFGQGFNAARDRLFQIDLWRRRGLGELSEVLGPAYVEQDRAARLFLYRGDMEQEWASYGPDARRMAAAFVAGINAYIDSLENVPDRMPVEFKVLGYAPAKWNVADVVRIRSHGLTGNLNSEVARANVICKGGTENGPKYDQYRVGLQPKWEIGIPEGLDPCLPAGVLKKFQLATQAVRFQKAPVAEEADASNNWTIAPSKSATGRPIVASDPHRAYNTPSLRYIAHVSAPGLNVIGAGEPSLPGISIGHNGTVAFGLTRFYIDQEDLYTYELNPEDGTQYRYRGAWQPMRRIREQIRVKGSSPVEAELLFTQHGPVIYSDAKRAYAVRSGWLEPGTAVYFGSASYMQARNADEFRAGVARAKAPGLNYVYALTSGDIGWVAGGLAPIRPNWDGLLPVPGDGRYEWSGFWKGEQLPSIENPAQGFIATANELNFPADYPYQERKLGFEWVNASRSERIHSVLRSLDKVSLQDSMKLQNDVVSMVARRLVALLASLKASEAKAEAALALLRGWDGAERSDSPQAALLEVWVSRHLGRAFLEAALPKDVAGAIAGPDVAVMVQSLEKRTVTDRDALLRRTLAAAYVEMERLQGPDPKKWQWGKLHHSLPAHPLLEIVDPALRAKLQVGPFPKAGGPYTPNQSGYRSSDFRQTGGPSFRVVMDVGKWDESRAINYPGQSGDPDDPHYSDLAKMWLNGEYFPLLYSRSAVEKATGKRIQLKPN